MKLYVDDQRTPPEGWEHAKTFHEALRMLSENGPEFTHVAFDWMLCIERSVLNGVNLLMELASVHFNETPVFTHPRENYTCHSSEKSKRDEMSRILDAIKASRDEDAFFNALRRRQSAGRDRPEQPLSRLDRLRRAKRR